MGTRFFLNENTAELHTQSQYDKYNVNQYRENNYEKRHNQTTQNKQHNTRYDPKYEERREKCTFTPQRYRKSRE